MVDSLNEPNAADITIRNTGDAAWKIQLKQSGIELEEGQWYRLSFTASSWRRASGTASPSKPSRTLTAN